MINSSFAYFKKKRNIVGLIVILVLLIGVPVTLYLAQTRQIFKPKAATSCVDTAQGNFYQCKTDEDDACDNGETWACDDTANNYNNCIVQLNDDIEVCNQGNGGNTGGTTPLNLIATPTGVCTTNNKQQVAVSWTATSGHTYSLTVQPQSGFASGLGSSAITSPYFDFEPNGSYTYSIQEFPVGSAAADNSGVTHATVSACSSGSGNTGGTMTITATNTNLTCTGSQATVNLSWPAVNGASTYYANRVDNGATVQVTTAPTVVNGTVYAADNVAPGSHTYEAKAFSSGGQLLASGTTTLNVQCGSGTTGNNGSCTISGPTVGSPGALVGPYRVTGLPAGIYSCNWNVYTSSGTATPPYANIGCSNPFSFTPTLSNTTNGSFRMNVSIPITTSNTIQCSTNITISGTGGVGGYGCSGGQCVPVANGTMPAGCNNSCVANGGPNPPPPAFVGGNPPPPAIGPNPPPPAFVGNNPPPPAAIGGNPPPPASGNVGTATQYKLADGTNNGDCHTSLGSKSFQPLRFTDNSRYPIEFTNYTLTSPSNGSKIVCLQYYDANGAEVGLLIASQINLNEGGTTTPPPPTGTTPPPPAGVTPPPPNGINPPPAVFSPLPSGVNGAIYTRAYKIAETEVGLATAPELPYTQHPTILSHTFADSTPGIKQVWVEFIAADDTPTNPHRVKSFSQIELVGSDPSILGCNVNNLGNGSNEFVINGSNFGTASGSVKSDLAGLTITRWTNTQVKATWGSAPSAASFPITLTRPDGQFINSFCSGISQLYLGAQLFCRQPQKFDATGVNVAIAEGANGGKKFKETVTIDKNGIVQGLKTQLEVGKPYRLSIKAPRSIRKSVEFYAEAGTTVVGNLINGELKPLMLPVGDIFPLNDPDGTINTADYGEMIREWVIDVDKTDRAADFNQDKRVNSVDWACMRVGFGAHDDQEATPGPVTIASPSATLAQ